MNKPNPRPPKLLVNSVVQLPNQLRFDDEDIVNNEEFTYLEDDPDAGLYIFHDHGVTLCCVWATNDDEAYEYAAESGKLDRYEIDPDDYATPEEADAAEGMGAYHDNRFFDFDTLGLEILPPPSHSFATLYRLQFDEKFRNIASILQSTE